jgi:hypothetical protein
VIIPDYLVISLTRYAIYAKQKIMTVSATGLCEKALNFFKMSALTRANKIPSKSDLLKSSKKF